MNKYYRLVPDLQGREIRDFYQKLNPVHKAARERPRRINKNLLAQEIVELGGQQFEMSVELTELKMVVSLVSQDNRNAKHRLQLDKSVGLQFVISRCKGKAEGIADFLSFSDNKVILDLDQADDTVLVSEDPVKLPKLHDKQSVQPLDKQVSEAKRIIAQQEEEIASLKEAVRDFEGVVHSLKNELHTKDQEVSRLGEQLKRKEQEVQLERSKLEKYQLQKQKEQADRRRRKQEQEEQRRRLREKQERQEKEKTQREKFEKQRVERERQEKAEREKAEREKEREKAEKGRGKQTFQVQVKAGEESLRKNSEKKVLVTTCHQRVYQNN